MFLTVFNLALFLGVLLWITLNCLVVISHLFDTFLWENLIQCFVSSQDAVRNGLVATEVLMWFYIGECIGKGGIVGYDVWNLDCHASYFSFERCMLNFLQQSWEPINRCLLLKQLCCNFFFLFLTIRACI